MIELLDGLYVQGTGSGIELLDNLFVGGGVPSVDVLMSGVSPLTLLNTISLNYVKAFGKCEQDSETYIDSVTLEGKCEQNGTPTPSTPVDIVCNNGTIKVSKNLCDMKTANIDLGHYISANGAYSESVNNFLYIPYIKVQPNTTYTLSFSEELYFITISEYSANDGTGFIQRNAGTSGGNTSLTITTTATTQYIRFGSNLYGNSNAVTYDQVLDIDWMLEQGATATPYKPYGQIYYDGTVETATDNAGNVATAQPLLSVGDYKDTQEVISGVVTRNVGVKVLDGTETWSKISNQNAYYTSIAEMLYCNPVEAGLSNQFVGAGVATADMPNNSVKLTYVTNPNIGAILFKHNDTTTLEDWAQFVTDKYNSGNPIIAIYPLATATTESVSGQVLNKEPVTVTGSLTGLVANTVSSTHTTPKPTQPLDIVANNGVIKYGQYGKNLFDINSSLVNGYINSSGAIVSGIQLKISPFIEIEPNTTYTLSGTGDVKALSFDRYAYTYTAEQTPIAQVPSQTGGASATFTTAQNAKYIRIQMTTDAVNTCQLELGSTATPYEPYHFGLHYDGTDETVQAHGKNLFDKALFNTDVGSTITYTTFEIPNGTYTMSTNFPISNNVTNVFIFEGEVTSGAATTTNGVYDGQSRTITVTNGKYTVAYRSTTSSSSNINNPKDYNFQLEQGSTATTYEPYFEGTTATCQPLLSVGTYKDVQNITNGAITRNVGVKVLDGTESFNIINNTFSYSALGNMPNNKVTSNYFDGDVTPTISTANQPDLTVKAHASVYGVYFKYSAMETATDFKAWLAQQYAAGTPVIVVYPLATPTTETVTGQTLTITQGTNIVTAEGSVDDLELEVSYKAYAEITVEEIEAVNTDENVEVIIS